MGILDSITYGFSVALQPTNLVFAFIGVFIGTAVGVLPGLGASGAIALLLPITFGMDPVVAVIVVAGIYYGTMYGGSTTSILVNIPGEAASVVTAMDGYQMARKGRAGAALGMCAFASFIAGTVGLILLTFLAPLLSTFALRFGPPENTVLLAVGLTLTSVLAMKSRLKGLMMVFTGLLLGTVGLDTISGSPRFTFGTVYLLDGLNFIIIVMGLFGISEVLVTIDEGLQHRQFIPGPRRLLQLLPNRQDWQKSAPGLVRGSLVGFLLGLLPGGGAIMASFISYSIEKKLSRHPEQFGTGNIEGVAAPEAANNSATAGAFIPLLTLGIPFNAVTALILAAFMIHGIRPGPLLMSQHPEIFWGVIASMYIGNFMLLVLNLPLIGLFVQILRVPYPILFPVIVVVTVLGSYSVHNNLWDVFVMITMGVVGYGLRKLGFELAPLALALILGPLLEASFRQSLILSHGSFGIFVSRPISGGLLATFALFLVFFAGWHLRAELKARGW